MRIFSMRIILTAFTLAVLTSWGTGPTLASSPCEDELKNARATFSKVRQKAIKQQKKGAVTKIEGFLRKAVKAEQEGDSKACHSHTKKVVALSKKIK